MSKEVLLLPILILLNVSLTAWSQTEDSKLEKVENGLVLQRTFEPGEKITRKNLVDKLNDYKIPGASVAVVDGGKIVWSKGYGYKDIERSAPITTETLFQSASIGKVITALAALSLVEDGKIELDEDVNLKLVRWKIPQNEYTSEQAVTLRHLLSHSAGFTDEYGFEGYGPQEEIPSLEQILQGSPPSNAKKTLEVETVPGTKERYSGGGYLVIQALIEDVSGEHFEDFVQKRVFDPFQMRHTTYDYRPDSNLGASVAPGHLGNGKALKKKNYNLYPEKAAAGPWTTPEDLSRMIIGIQKLKNTDNEMILELLTPQINRKGLGINLKGLDAPEAFWHAGQNLGYTALMYGLTERGSGAVVMVNTDGGEKFMQEFITSVADTYDWPVMRSIESRPISADAKSELAGVFQNDDKSVTLIVEEGKNGMSARPGESKKGYPLYHIGNNQYTFKDAQDYYRLTFEKSSDVGSTVKLTYTESIGKTVQLSKK